MRTPPERCASTPFLRLAFWWSIAACGALVLAVAAIVEPDARGFGTHTQLGLPPCGFLAIAGFPCPGCGLTTAFAHAVRGDWLVAAGANPLGLVLFFVTCASIPLGVIAALRGWPVDRVVERFAIGRWALAVAGVAVMLWVARAATVL